MRTHVKRPSNYQRPAVYAIAFILIGGALLLVTQAASPATSMEAEAGTLTGQAILGNDSMASGGKYVAFGTNNIVASVPFAASSPWNTAILSSTTWTASAILSASHWWVNDEAYSVPVVTSSSSQPLVAVQAPASWGWPAATLQLNIAAGVTGASGTDAALLVISNGTAYNFWQFNRVDATHATASAYAEASLSGSGWGTPSPFLGAGIRAVGASELGGLITGSDLSAGAINHALAISLDSSITSNKFVPPAISSDGSASGSVSEGARLGIPAGTSMPGGLSSVGQMVWNAFMRYGGYVVDTSGGNTLYADPNSVPPSAINPLRNAGASGQSDLDIIIPHLKIAN
jgi:hypothetical protein